MAAMNWPMDVQTGGDAFMETRRELARYERELRDRTYKHGFLSAHDKEKAVHELHELRIQCQKQVGVYVVFAASSVAFPIS